MIIFGLSVILGYLHSDNLVFVFSDGLDNCPEIKNPEQINSDNDVLGDECDED